MLSFESEGTLNAIQVEINDNECCLDTEGKYEFSVLHSYKTAKQCDLADLRSNTEATASLARSDEDSIPKKKERHPGHDSNWDFPGNSHTPTVEEFICFR